MVHSAIAEAQFVGDNHVGTEHFVLGLLARPEAIDDASLRQSSINHRKALTIFLLSRAHWRYRDGKLDEAVSICDMLLCEPNAAALNLKAWILATAADARYQRSAEAVELAKRACELTEGKEVEYLDTLAACHAANGDFGEAVRLTEQAVAGAAEAKVAVYRARLELYQCGKAYHDPAIMTAVER